MDKHAQQQRAAESSRRRTTPGRRLDLDRRSFLTTGAAGAVAAGLGATESAAQGAMRWDMTADVVVIGAGVAGLAGGDRGARCRRLGDRGRRELRHRRPRHAERRTGAARRRSRPAAEIQHQGRRRQGVRRLGAARPRRKPAQRPRPGAGVRRRERLDLQFPDRERRRVHREADHAAGRLHGGPHLRHQGVAHSERGGRAAPKPQRLGPGAKARRKRAQEGRADPAQAQDDLDRAREPQSRPRARHRRAGAATAPSTCARPRA